MGLWVAWQLWQRVVRRPWIVTMPPGLRLKLLPHDPVTSGVLYCGLPDWPEMPFVLDYLQAGDVMIDVGANIGLYSLLAASVDGVYAVAFEPDEGARTRAAANASLNGLANRIQIHPLAVGCGSGQGSLTTGLGPQNRLLGGAEAAGADAGRAQPVVIVSLDDSVDGPVALVKVDVEGGEVAVIEGAGRLLETNQPVLILEANDPSALTDQLGRLGYQWVNYDPQERRVAVVSAPKAGSNGIAVRDLDAVAARLERRPSWR